MSNNKSVFSNKSVLALVPYSNNYPVLALVPYSKVQYNVRDKEYLKIPGYNIPILTKIERELDDLFTYRNTNLFTLKSKVLFSLIDKAVEEFTEINKKGFVNDTNLANYPIVKDYISLLLSDKAKEILKENGKDAVAADFEDDLELVSVGDLKISYRHVKTLYNWIYNMYHLKLLLICETFLCEYNYKNDENPDIFTDFKVLTRSLFFKLDPTIRTKLVKKGMSIIQNVYTGFDSEFKNVDFKFNKLLSVQLAITTKTILKIPLNSNFDSVKKVKWINTMLINSVINNSIKYYRRVKYGSYDISMDFIINKLTKKIFSVEKDDFVYFIFNRGFVKLWFKVLESVSFINLVLVSNKIGMGVLNDEKDKIMILLDSISAGLDYNEFYSNLDKPTPLNTSNISEVEYEDEYEVVKEVKEVKGVKGVKNTKYLRFLNRSMLDEKVSITVIKNNYFISHLTNADLSMLSDFNELKHKLDIVNNSFVTLKNTLLIGGFNVFIRDTMLLAPAGKKGLDALGSLHGFEKVPLTKEQIENMDLLLSENPILFKKYALQDSLITLMHACHMEDFCLGLGLIGIPITLSNVSYAYLKKDWRVSGYEGYQLSEKYLFGDVSKTLTPKGLFATKEVGMKMPMYISNYKGGRNEGFMYGYNTSPRNIFKDWDIISAYTTVMSALGHPNYYGARTLSIKEFKELSFNDILYSYTAINTEFSFPEDTKYPSIGCKVDENTTMSPLNGTAVITGSEYLVAKAQGCKFVFKEIFHIPFSWVFVNNRKQLLTPPFRDSIKKLQILRREHKKGTFLNSLYKELGNSIYGLTARGIGLKLKYDIKTKEMKRMVGNDLANPIIASWTTAFIRSIIGELLHNIHKLNGLVLSTTTDGFVCNLEDLENLIIKNPKLNKSLLMEFRKLRRFLSNDFTALELKGESKKPGAKFVSIKTRGQISSESGIVALTGYQKGNRNLVSIESILEEIMKSDDKSYVYLQKRLRSGKNLFTDGGHVTMVFRDQKYSLNYDNKRLIIENKNDTLLDSRPLKSVYECDILRHISKLPNTIPYSEFTPSMGTAYKNIKEMILRNFIKALLNNELNLNSGYFKNYKEIINFIHGYDPDSKINETYIAQLKRRGNFVVIPKTKESDEFSEYVKATFPLFDYNKFVNKTNH